VKNHHKADLSNFECNYELNLSPVDLGLAENFAILAASTVTSAVDTTVTGNIGVYPGTAVTGFGPGVIKGNFDLGNPEAMEAQASLLAAYQMAAAKNQTALLSGTDLGGLTLTPGVYRFDTTAALTGVLTLNASGIPDASWTFQIGSALLIAGGSRVEFVDGFGNPDCVFWQVGSSATLLGDTSMLGNVMAYASISMKTGASITGRLLAKNGAVTLISDQVIIPPNKCKCMH
jgi:hypothetical protein